MDLRKLCFDLCRMREHADKSFQHGQQLRGIGKLTGRNYFVSVFQQKAQQHHSGFQTNFPKLQDCDDDGAEVIQYGNLLRVAFTLLGETVGGKRFVVDCMLGREGAELHRQRV